MHWCALCIGEHVCSHSPGGDKCIDNLPCHRKLGTICNLFLYIISWDHELLV